MLDALRIGTGRNRLRLAAVALASSVLLATPAVTLAEQSAPDDWVGKAVVPKARDFTLKDAQSGSPVQGPREIYHVAEVNGKLVLLATAGIVGWAPVDQVVPLELANAFFTNKIRQNPTESFSYTMRAIVALALQGDVDRALEGLTHLHIGKRTPGRVEEERAIDAGIFPRHDL